MRDPDMDPENEPEQYTQEPPAPKDFQDVDDVEDDEVDA